jgi:hypothetical protein
MNLSFMWKYPFSAKYRVAAKNKLQQKLIIKLRKYPFYYTLLILKNCKYLVVGRHIGLPLH